MIILLLILLAVVRELICIQWDIGGCVYSKKENVSLFVAPSSQAGSTDILTPN